MTDTKDSRERFFNVGPLQICLYSLFVARTSYPRRSLTGERAPVFERLETQQETEPPWRKGHGFIIRLWPTHRAIMLGYWGEPVVDEYAGDTRGLLEVIGAGDKKFVPITSLLGVATEAETVERAANHILAGEASDEDLLADDNFVLIDLRNEPDAITE